MTKKDKEELHNLYEKHYGKGKNKKAKVQGPNRADLIVQAKEKGIKNFRILNKEELTKVLAPETTKEDIDKIIQSAVTRWKTGWGNRGGRAATQKA